MLQRMTLLAATNFSSYDTDAQSYITAVEVADTAAGQSGGLETATKDAINAFVVGCKTDGIWSAIKASCILAGARTLSGALVPLVGSAPTNVNFVSGDYNRKTGLKGNGTTQTPKYLNTNRADNSDPQNNHHLSVYCSAVPTFPGGQFFEVDFPVLIGSTVYGTTGATQLFFRKSNGYEVQHRHTTTIRTNAAFSPGAVSFVGVARNASTTVTMRANNTSVSLSITSEAPGSTTTKVFAIGNGANNTSARISFYSIGESLDLSLLNSRVTTLVNAMAAIP